MGPIRSKILFGLIIYFVGFASAIYYLAPKADKIGCGGAKKLNTRSSHRKVDTNKLIPDDLGDSLIKYKTIAEEKTMAMGEMLKDALAKRNEK